MEEEDEIAEEKSPLDGAWYKRKQNLPGENRAGQDFFCTFLFKFFCVCKTVTWIDNNDKEEKKYKYYASHIYNSFFTYDNILSNL